MNEIKKYQVPTIAEIFSDNIQEAFKSEQLNLLLNSEPKQEWIKTHPIIKNYRYLPIDKVEFMLRKIFKRYRIEITAQGSVFNGVWVTVRVHYLNPATGELDFHDGIGACQLQTKAGTSPSDLININNGAISMAFPIAKTVAVKDACDHFGKLFGSDLNRKDTIVYSPDMALLDKGKNEKTELPEELLLVIAEADFDALANIYKTNKEYHANPEFMKLLTERKTQLKNG